MNEQPGELLVNASPAEWFAASMEPDRYVVRWLNDHVITPIEGRTLLEFYDRVGATMAYSRAVFDANRRSGIPSNQPCSLASAAVKVWSAMQSPGIEAATPEHRAKVRLLGDALAKVYNEDVVRPRQRDQRERDARLARRATEEGVSPQ